MFGRDDAHRNIREQIAHDRTMPQRIDRYFTGIEPCAQTARRNNREWSDCFQRLPFGLVKSGASGSVLALADAL